MIEILYCCVTLLELRFYISLESFSWVWSLKENVQFEFLILFLRIIMLECLEKFSIDWRTRLVWDVPEVRYGFLDIFRGFTILLKDSWKVSATFLSLEMIFSFLISLIFSLNLIVFEKKSAAFFQNFFSHQFYITFFKIRAFRLKYF